MNGRSNSRRAWRGATVVQALCLATLVWPVGDAAAVSYTASASVGSRQSVNGRDLASFGDSESFRDRALPGSSRALLTTPSDLGSAYALAQFGTLRVDALAVGTSMGGAEYMTQSSATARFDDEVIFTGSGLRGSGLAFARVFLHAPLEVVSADTRSGQASVSGGISLDGGRSVPFSFGSNINGQMNPMTPVSFTSVPSGRLGLGGYWDIEVPFTVGEVVDLTLTVTASAISYPHSTFVGGGSIWSTTTSAANFANSFYWGGISAVRIDGVTTTDFTASGADGNDWRASYVPSALVPEPQSWALWAGGLLSLAALRRRRAR